MKGRRFIVAFCLALVGAGGVAVSWALGSGTRAAATTTVTTTVSTTVATTTIVATTTVAATTVTVNGGGASSSASSSSSSGGSNTGGQQQQQQQQGGGGGTVIVVVNGGNGNSGTTTVTTTTAPFTPPTSTLVVARGSATVRRTSTGWSVVVRFTSTRSSVARACVMTNGVCVRTYAGIALPGGQAGLALAVPFSVGAGLHTIRVNFRAGAQLRTVLWPVNLT